MTPEIITAISVAGPGAVIIALAIVYGWPALKEYLGMQTEREKLFRDWAEKGPAELILQLRSDLIELKAEVKELRGVNDGLQQDRRQCEREQAELKATVNVLKAQNAEQAGKILSLEGQIAELKKQQGIWQQIETKARVAGDAANAEQPK